MEKKDIVSITDFSVQFRKVMIHKIRFVYDINIILISTKHHSNGGDCYCWHIFLPHLNNLMHVHILCFLSATCIIQENVIWRILLSKLEIFAL